MTNVTRLSIAPVRIACLGLLMLTVLPSALRADIIGTKPWTTVGSAGTVIEGQVVYTGASAFLDGDRAVLLYNVVAVDGLQETNGFQPVHPIMQVKFRDNGANNRVVAILKRVDLNTGATHNMMTMDSDTYPGSPSAQDRLISSCGNSFSFDFSKYAFYVEVTLTRTNLPVTAAITHIQLGTSDSPCIAAF